MPPLAFKFAAGFKNAASDYIDKVRRFERNVIFFLLGSFLVGTGLMVWNLLFNLYLQERGFDKATIGFVLAIGNAAMGIMAIPSGILTYYIPMKKQLIGAQTLGAVFFVCALFAPDKYLLYAAIFFALGSMTAMRVVEGPFIMRNSKKEERAYVFGAMFIIMLGGGMMGFLFGGALKDVFIGLGSSNVGGYRAAMCVGILFSLLGTIPYFFIREPAASPDAPKRKKLNLRGLNWKFFGKALLPGLIVSTGAGLIVQFMNLYFKDVFNSSDSQIGVYMSGQSAAMAVGLMIAPALSDKIGKVKTIVFTQLASLPFMVWLGFAGTVQLAVALFIIRAALMNMSAPISNALILENCKEDEQGMLNSLMAVTWSLSWSVSAIVYGRFLKGNYTASFLIAAVLYLISALVYYAFFKDAEKAAVRGCENERAVEKIEY